MAEQEVSRRQCELDSKLKKPAEAEKMRCEIMAHANHQKTLLEAAGVAESIQTKGEAEAFAVETKGKAKAEEMAMKADAWKEYQKAAKVRMHLNYFMYTNINQDSTGRFFWRSEKRYSWV